MAESESLAIGAKLREAGRHTIIYGLGSVAQSASGLILLPVLTGSLTKDDFGVYTLILMVSTIASAVFYFGMTSALPRSYFDYEADEDRRAVFTTAFIVLAAGAILQTVIGYNYGTDIAYLLVDNREYGSAVAWALVGGSLSFVNQYFFAYLRLLRKSVTSVLFSLVSLAGSVGLTLYFLSLQPGSIEAPFKAITYSQLIISVIYLAIYGRSGFTWKIDLSEVPKLLHFGIASIFASFGSMMLEWLDRLVIEHYMTLADVGTYSAAFRVAGLINVLLILPFAQIWNPMMMEYKNRTNIKELFSYVFSVFMILGGVLIIASALFANDILPILIRSGIDQITIVVFIVGVLGILIFGSTNFVAAGLLYERKVFSISYVYYSVALAKLGFTIVLIPMLGLIGAVLSTLIAYIMLPVGIYYMAKPYFSFKIDWVRLFKFIIISLPSFYYGLHGSTIFDINWLIRILWLIFSLTLIYLVCVSSSEKRIIRNFLQRGVA